MLLISCGHNQAIVIDTFCMKYKPNHSLPKPQSEEAQKELKAQIDLMGLSEFVRNVLVNNNTYESDC